jgi:signal transduction histidine kinase
MNLRDIPIRKKLILVIMLITGAVLFITCTSFLIYEIFNFRQRTSRQHHTLGKIIASNSTAALAFGSREDATEILNALQAESNIEAAILYDNNGKIFSYYPENLELQDFPFNKQEGYHFTRLYIEGHEPVIHGNRRLGTLFLRSNLKELNMLFRLYGIMAVIVVSLSVLVAFLLARIMQGNISKPILALAETAKAVSERKDYSVRASRLGKDELGSLTEAFNQMLMQIETQNHALSRLNQSQKEQVDELQKINSDLDNFIYTASHDLKAPISNIEGLILSLKEEVKDFKNKPVEEMLGMIELSIQRFKNTILDLTEITKIQKQIEVEINLVNFEELLNDILVDSQNIITANNAQINIELNGCKELKFSRKNIRSIIYNLVSNAIKYRSPDRRPVVSIRTEIMNEFCVISVKDNGLGLAPEQKEKIFQMFKRFHDHVEGTGIGLYIVKRIVENAGGKIEGESEKGKGSEFKVYLKI